MNTKKNPVLFIIMNWEEIFCALAMAAMLVVCCLYVLARYVLTFSIVWGQEFCTICLIYVTFVGSAAAYKRNQHYGMDFIVSHLPEKINFIIKMIINFVLIILFAVLTVLSFQYTMAAQKTMPVSLIPYKYIDFAAVLGFGSMTIYSAIFFVSGIKNPEGYKKRFLTSEGGGETE